MRPHASYLFSGQCQMEVGSSVKILDKTNCDCVMEDMQVECFVNGETAGCAEEHHMQLNLTEQNHPPHANCRSG